MTVVTFAAAVPPSNVALYRGSEPITNGSTLVLTSSHDHSSYYCRVDVAGDHRAPHVSVVLDDQDITERLLQER